MVSLIPIVEPQFPVLPLTSLPPSPPPPSQGQAHGKVRGHRGAPDPSDGHYGGHHPSAGGAGAPGPSGSVPGSPVTYSPQLPMEPLRHDGAGSVYGPSEFAGWGAQPKLVPTVIVYSHGGNSVQLEGSFDNWTQRHMMQRSGKDFTLVKLLPPGVYQYKFIVDGLWRHDPNQKSMFDDQGNINNVLEVQEYVPENLGSLSGFEPPPSPTASYACPPAQASDFVKEPPAMPPQLQLSLLNVPPALDSIAALPRPQHVVLNHLYLQRVPTTATNAAVMGTTYRYRSKYVTTVLYRPRARPEPKAASTPSMAVPSAARPQSSDVSMQYGAGGAAQYNQAAQSAAPAPMVS
jgi:5'-AMP-activated protein kinase regulatory beta subunit